jgi:hypothetical protein
MGLFSNDQANSKKQAAQYRQLIRKEAVIGGKLFGPVPKNGRREFFCLDERTWVWHEEWTDTSGQRHVLTTRYDVRPDGVVKTQNSGHYIKVSLSEARHLLEAAKLYKQRVQTELYAHIT